MSLYYNSLFLNKKGRFRKIWIAAHTPSKLNRTDVISIDLSKMCDEIKDFVINNSKSIPKFNLYISSHLMLGLSRVLHKKSVYLYDDLKTFNVEIKQTFYFQIDKTMLGRSGKKGDKTLNKSKKKAQPRISLVLNENLPDMFDKTFMVGFNFDKELDMINRNVEEANKSRPANRRPNITLNDTSLNWTMPPQEPYDYATDMFGVPPSSSALPIPPIMLPPAQNLDGLYLEQTVMPKPTRTPFRQIQNLPNGASTIPPPTLNSELQSEQAIRHLELSKGSQQRDDIQKMHEAFQTNLLDSTDKPGLNINQNDVGLFQETIVEPQQQPELQPIADEEQRIVALGETIMDYQEAGAAAPSTISAVLDKLILTKTAKEQKAQQPKRRKLIWDQKTMISDEEMRSRMIPAAEESTRDFFLPMDQQLKTKCDFNALDLFKLPCKLSRNVNQDLSKQALKYNKHYQLIVKNMRTQPEEDHDFFYLTEMHKMKRRARLLEEEVGGKTGRKAKANEMPLPPPEVIDAVHSETLPPPLPPPQIVIEDAEELRESLIEAQKKKRQSKTPAASRLEQSNADDRKSAYAENPVSTSKETVAEQPNLAEQPFEYPDMNTLPPMENIMDLTAVAAVKETFLQENDNAYEVIIVEFLEREKLNHCDKPVFFSDIVYKAEQTERCKRAAKPRRLFATYLFSSMLNLSAKRKIFIDQMVQNGPIELNFVQV